MPKASAQSLPGRTRSQQSASRARRCCRGSMTMSLAPLARARVMRWAEVGNVASGLAPPEEDAARVIVIRRRRRGPESMLGAEEHVPRADVHRGQHIRAAEGIGEAEKPIPEIGGCATGWCRTSEDHRLGTVSLPDFREPRYDGVQGLLPGD